MSDELRDAKHAYSGYDNWKKNCSASENTEPRRADKPYNPHHGSKRSGDFAVLYTGEMRTHYLRIST